MYAKTNQSKMKRHDSTPNSKKKMKDEGVINYRHDQGITKSLLEKYKPSRRIKAIGSKNKDLETKIAA